MCVDRRLALGVFLSFFVHWGLKQWLLFHLELGHLDCSQQVSDPTYSTSPVQARHTVPRILHDEPTLSA